MSRTTWPRASSTTRPPSWASASSKRGRTQEVHRRLGARARLGQRRSQGRACRADRLAPDRHSGQRADGGRTREAVASRTAAARAPGGPGRSGARGSRCRAVVARGAARRRQAGGDFSVPRADRRGQDRARQGAGRVHLWR